VDLTGVASDYLLTTFTLTHSIVAGGVYQFRYRAANKYGWGPYSEAAAI